MEAVEADNSESLWLKRPHNYPRDSSAEQASFSLSKDLHNHYSSRTDRNVDG